MSLPSNGNTCSNNGNARVQINRKEEAISIPVATFSAISVSIGAGMVAIPKASFESGIPFGVFYNMLNLILTIYSIHLLLESARVTGLYSMPRLAYECFGHCSLYFVNFAQFIGKLPFSQEYSFRNPPYCVFYHFCGNTQLFLQRNTWVIKSKWRFIGSQWFSVLILGVILFPLIIKKRIGELSIAAALLFGGVIIFNILLVVIMIDPNVNTDYKSEDQSRLYRFEFNQTFLSSLSTAFVAYGFQAGFFPIYNALEQKGYRNGMRFSMYAMIFCFLIYVLIMFTGLYNFGVNIRGDVLVNVSMLRSWESYVIRVIFLLIMITHTPFVFFVGKESVLCFAVLINTAIKNEEKEDKYAIMIDENEEDLSQEKPHKNGINGPKLDINEESRSQSRSKADNMLDKKFPQETTEDVLKSLAMSSARKSHGDLPRNGNEDELDFENAAAHELLPDSIYYPTTIIFFVILVGSSCVIEDIEIVVKFVGSLGYAILNFLIPSITYFLIMKKYEPEKTSNLKLYSALFLAIYSGVLVLICTGVNVWTAIVPLED
ncbi:unnamed protein product [Moneuplotes crassus]|uniref:Amino acid transporter transmembrane domain-containing protein n=1 Tax=Euplotes crassus TaxID=5936 RepID=A0AAD1UDP4_EUPCR|nr:unnamed protein product [Moneuplotes crassus]